MLQMLFVRHGRTTWNVEGRVQGGGDLDEVGRTQAMALANRLSEEKIVTVIQYFKSLWPEKIRTHHAMLIQ